MLTSKGQIQVSKQETQAITQECKRDDEDYCDTPLANYVQSQK